MAERLAATFEFYYIQPLGLRNLQWKDATRAFKRACDLVRPEPSHQKVAVKNLIFIPSVKRYLHLINVPLLKRQLAPLVNSETIIWITSPADIFPSLLRALNYKALVYEMLDDYAAIHTARKDSILSTEAWLINKADLIITTSSSLSDKARKMRADDKILLIGNGVDHAFFSKTTSERPSEFGGVKTVIGYVGSVDTWLDLQTIEFLADARKDLHFFFVGPVRIRNLPLGDNIHYLGRREYYQVPHYVSHFDACLIPFKKGEFADTINPVKLFEYFALGKPVIAYYMKELAPFRDCMYLAEDKKDFLQKLERAIAENDVAVKDRRKEIARRNDWSAKSGAIAEILSKL